jgi:glycosyltransferase involved in cell wall biosynthesis
MRIAFLVPAPFTTVSGGYAYDRRMVEGLRAAGHAVDVIELDGRHPLPDDAAHAAAARAWAALPAEAHIVIDGLGLPAFAPLADALAARGATGLIHHPTAIEPGFGEEERNRLRTAERALLPLLARVIVTSAPTADQLVKDFGVDRARIAIVLPGTAPAARVGGSGGAGCEILAVGTLVPRKGHDVLMRALARLFDLDWHLTIVGSPGRDRVHADGLRALADTLRIADRVTFAGELGETELDALWRKTDIFALATWWEGYGMAVAEALRRGIPVAVTAGGAAAALVPVEAGITCQPGDVDGYSKALRRMVFDTGLRHDMAEAAWRAGQALPDWDAQISAFAQALA